MQKKLFVMSLITLLSFLSMQVVAQTINSATDLKNFYMKYLSDDPDADERQLQIIVQFHYIKNGTKLHLKYMIHSHWAILKTTN